MTKEEFEVWANNVLCALYHISPNDLENGVRIDQKIVIGMIHNHPEVLVYEDLTSLLKRFGVDDSHFRKLKTR